jgi:hypothetical protein
MPRSSLPCFPMLPRRFALSTALNRASVTRQDPVVGLALKASAGSNEAGRDLIKINSTVQLARVHPSAVGN